MTNQTEKTPRKIVQIAVIPETDSEPRAAFALCNDGTFWFLDNGFEWTLVPAIPQEDTP